jgi:hypothetical protein
MAGDTEGALEAMNVCWESDKHHDELSDQAILILSVTSMIECSISEIVLKEQVAESLDKLN